MMSEFRKAAILFALCLLSGAGCSTASPKAPSGGEPAPKGASTAEGRASVVRVPDEVPAEPWQKRIVATHLMNPRGVLELSNDRLLVAEAGTGDPNHPLTGRIIELDDLNHDGDFDDDKERVVVADQQPSVNILRRVAVNRDEVFGLADIEQGGGIVVATLADPTTGSVLLEIKDRTVRRWSTTRDNANSIAYDPKLNGWFAVQSFANTVISIAPNGAERLLAKIPALEAGQQPVPAALAYEPATGGLLVALFSGQKGGDTAGSGVDFVERSGKLVRIDPTNGSIASVVESLNAPTDVAVGPVGQPPRRGPAARETDGDLYVLEFCRKFEDPVHTVGEATSGVRHAGFERFSGRLLRVQLETGRVISLASGLDLPTHIRLKKDGRILVTEGQGTPGRMIPGPSGPTALEGRLVELTAPPHG